MAVRIVHRAGDKELFVDRNRAGVRPFGTRAVRLDAVVARADARGPCTENASAEPLVKLFNWPTGTFAGAVRTSPWVDVTYETIHGNARRHMRRGQGHAELRAVGNVVQERDRPPAQLRVRACARKRRVEQQVNLWVGEDLVPASRCAARCRPSSSRCKSVPSTARSASRRASIGAESATRPARLNRRRVGILREDYRRNYCEHCHAKPAGNGSQFCYAQLFPTARMLTETTLTPVFIRVSRKMAPVFYRNAQMRRKTALPRVKTCNFPRAMAALPPNPAQLAMQRGVHHGEVPGKFLQCRSPGRPGCAAAVRREVRGRVLRPAV